MEVANILQAAEEDCYGPYDFSTTIIVVVICCVLGLLWAAYNVILVRKINVEQGTDGESESLVGDIPEGQKQLLLELG